MLKLSKLPDRTPIKIIVTVSVLLNQALHGYASLYHATYGEAASVSELIPFMLDGFLKSDPAFAKALKEGLLDKDIKKQTKHAGRKLNDVSTPAIVSSNTQSQEA